MGFEWGRPHPGPLPRERENAAVDPEVSENVSFPLITPTILPSPEVEGWGEGKRSGLSASIDSGLRAAAHIPKDRDTLI